MRLPIYFACESTRRYPLYCFGSYIWSNASFTWLVRIATASCIFVAILSYHQDQLPYYLLATLGINRLGIPFDVAVEMFIALLFLEILREAGIRLPSAVGSTVTVVGGLILGMRPFVLDPQVSLSSEQLHKSLVQLYRAYHWLERLVPYAFSFHSVCHAWHLWLLSWIIYCAQPFSLIAFMRLALLGPNITSI